MREVWTGTGLIIMIGSVLWALWSEWMEWRDRRREVQPRHRRPE